MTRSHQSQAWALVDTGFDGYLSVPVRQLEQLGDPDTLEPWRLASGQIIYLPEYRGTVEIVGLSQVIPAVILSVGDEFVLGRAVPNRFRVILDTAGAFWSKLEH